jgi:hypothetical protein
MSTQPSIWDDPHASYSASRALRRCVLMGTEAPRIVCLCGSTRFKQVFIAENARLTMLGFIVLSVGFFGHGNERLLSVEEKTALDELHKRKIELADIVHVLNVGGYTGDSTRSEIQHALNLGKPIVFLEDLNCQAGETLVDALARAAAAYRG